MSLPEQAGLALRTQAVEPPRFEPVTALESRIATLSVHTDASPRAPWHTLLLGREPL